MYIQSHSKQPESVPVSKQPLQKNSIPNKHHLTNEYVGQIILCHNPTDMFTSSTTWRPERLTQSSVGEEFDICSILRLRVMSYK